MRQDLTQPSRDVLRELLQGQLELARLREVQRAQRHEERVIHRPNETVYETVKTTIEVFYFD